MAARRTASVKLQRNSHGFAAALASAVLEWLLIFLLFIDAVFSYLVMRFACYCELKPPCPLCSRLDHVLGNEKPGFYWNLICREHKFEVSSVIFCHVHDKLADVHGICEGCLFSFAMEHKSNSETCRLLVGKLGMDIECCDDQDTLLKDPKHGTLSTKNCSCCNEPWRSRSYAERFPQTKTVGSEIAELDVPLPGFLGQGHLHLRDRSKRRRGEPSGVVLSSRIGNSGFDSLAHIGYTELKITSDSESEVPFSDDDDGSALVREADDPKKAFISPHVQLRPCSASPDIFPKTLIDDTTSEKLFNQASTPMPSVLVTDSQLDARESHDVTSSESAFAIGHGLEELNWHQVEQKADTSAPPEFISLDDVPPPSNSNGGPVEVTTENCNLKVESKETGEFGRASVDKDVEVCKLESDMGMTSGEEKTDQVSNDPIPLLPSYMDLSDAYKLAISSKGRQLSGMLAEQISAKDSARINEDLKLLLLQISVGRGIELPLNDTTPGVAGLGDEQRFSDASSSMGTQLLQKRISIERNESGFESLDGSIVSEFEGESVVDRLKRQVEYDRKNMGALYTELDEERSASAVAANQAMAMITRLQEEKAALHMEALQYLRMMEEQAEYDVDALQKANDLLADREKDIQDLEAELEYYRKKFPNELLDENLSEPTGDLKSGDKIMEHSDASVIENNLITPSNLVLIKEFQDSDRPERNDMVCGDKNAGAVKNPLLEFDDEKLYISQCLKKLEKKLHLFSNNVVHGDFSNGGYSGEEAAGNNDPQEHHDNEETRGMGQMEENGSSMKKDSIISRKSHSAQEGCAPSVGDPLSVSKENNHFVSDGNHSSLTGEEIDLVSLGNEVSELNERLEALEADRNFLEHTMNSLRNGDMGLQFIQEIALHLRELRKIGIKRDQAIA